jgi:KUP system potassium uptake protein
MPHDSSETRKGLTLVALGIVFGDIGTSPLYAVRESIEGPGHELLVTQDTVLGLLSLIFWSLIIVVTLKYLVFVMRADNEGEGGILALTSLLGSADRRGLRHAMILFGLFGTALLYGDGMITPAISVLSAVEGTEVATSAFTPWVLPIAVAILVGLFSVQARGTASIGRVFGPVMVIWFGTLAILGLWHLLDEPRVVEAINPAHAWDFFHDNGFKGFLALGSVFLVVTGAEALYADMGHFGRRPIERAWFALVLPALVLNYMGQGAMLLDDPGAIDNPFYNLVPRAWVIPLVVLATVATVIASQALISGAFSLTRQAVQLGYAPRLNIRHTSEAEIGQIYVPVVNWVLMVAAIGLVIGFGTSARLASAYGVAVTMTMVITTVLFYSVARERLGWSASKGLAICGAFLVIDLAFFGANVFKIADGGWFPLVVGGIVFALLTTWRTGRSVLAERIGRDRLPLARFLESVFLHEEAPTRVEGTGVYLFSIPDSTPPALLTNYRHNHVMHEQILCVSIITERVPRVLPAQRSEVVAHGHGVNAVMLHYGYMEAPDVPEGLTQGDASRLGIDPELATYFLGSESIVIKEGAALSTWRWRLFRVMSRNATSAPDYFGIPLARTVTVGTTVEL